MLDIKLKLKPGHRDAGDWMAPSPLRSLFWNVTYACNFRCRVCFSNAGAAEPAEMTTAEAREFIRRVHDLGIRSLILSGGEPFLRPDLLDLLRYMADLGITARIASNGSLLTDELLRRLREETMTASFMINLDSLDPAVYGRVHGTRPEAAAEAVGALRRVRDHGFHTTLAVRLMPATLGGIPDILDLAAAEDWRTIGLMLPLPVGRSADTFPPDADVFAKLGPVFEHFLSLPDHWLVETRVPWAEHHPIVQQFSGRIEFSHLGCRACRASMAVQPSGRVTPCLCLDTPATTLGNVLRDDLGAVFRDSPIAHMMRRPWEHGACADCEHVTRCGSGCRAMALALTGRLDAPDPSCPLRRAAEPGRG